VGATLHMNNLLGSPSPVRGGFDECIEDENHNANSEENAFNTALCSRKGTRQSDGWTSSEDEAQETEDDEGNDR